MDAEQLANDKEVLLKEVLRMRLALEAAERQIDRLQRGNTIESDYITRHELKLQRRLDKYRDLARHAYGLLRQKRPKVDNTIFYDCVDAECYRHTELGDAVDEFLDGSDVDTWPEQIRVKAYRRKAVPDREKHAIAELLLERVMEELYEEYGDPDGDYSNLSSAHAAEALKAARRLVDDICNVFPVWSCEEVKEMEQVVNTAAWVKEFSPEWLEEEAVKAFVDKHGGTDGG